MAVGIYQFYDENEVLHLLYVPRFSGDSRKPGNQNWYTIEEATSDLGEQFDHTATFFTDDTDTRDTLVAQGFTNVFATSELSGEVWSTANGLTITFEEARMVITKESDSGFVLRLRTNEYAACTFPSDTTNTTWISSVAGYYGVINAVSGNQFQFYYNYPVNLLSQDSFDRIWNNEEPFSPPSDPYGEGGTTGDDDTESEGGDGTFENEEVTVDPPALPSISALTSGFIAVYMPSFSQLQALGDYLWSDLFSLDTFKKLFSDPMQAILGLSIVPVAPPTQEGYVVIGNVNTGLTMPRVTRQFVTVDCGSITIPEYWGGYLDYSPYTKVEIYLPYIGVRPLDTDEVMGKTLSVVYHVDVLSGSCACFIQCDNTIRYHYVGQCGASIPITANDWTRVVNGAVSIATALGVGVATLGAGAAAAGGITAASMAGTGALVGGIASQVLASKPRVEHSGSLAGMGGLLGVQFPYIMIQRPRQAVPSGQNAFTGYPSFIKRTLSTVTGYTQVTGVHLTGLSCTDEEKKEIQAYLEAGVIL